MKLTKFTQSCVKIENDGRALLVDIGGLTSDEDMAAFGDYDAILYTHSHFDHFDVEKLAALVRGDGIVVYGNANVAEKAESCPIEVIENGEELVIADFKVKAFEMEHCLMSDGSPAGIPNTGFLINDYLLLPGDSTVNAGITAKVVAVPIFGPDISPKDAIDLMKATGAELALPVHYDVAKMDPAVFETFAGLTGEPGFQIKALKNGESTEI